MSKELTEKEDALCRALLQLKKLGAQLALPIKSVQILPAAYGFDEREMPPDRLLGIDITV